VRGRRRRGGIGGLVKPGFTQEIRSRAHAHMAAETKWQRLATTAALLAVVAIGAFFLIRWLS